MQEVIDCGRYQGTLMIDFPIDVMLQILPLLLADIYRIKRKHDVCIFA